MAIANDEPDRSKPTLFGQYADEWLSWRAISDRTRSNYRRLLDIHLLPTFAATGLRDIRPDAVDHWYVKTAARTPTVRTHASSLLRSIMETAVTDGLIDANPCQIAGVSTSHRAAETRPATPGEIEAMTAAMPEAYRILVPMTAWLAMPFSELRELRRKDIDLADNVVRVRRAVALIHGIYRVTTPRSAEGIRDIPIPPHLLPAINAHLRKHVQPGPDSLLFPSVRDPDRYLSPPVLDSMFRKARAAAGRPDLRVPDLRRSGARLQVSPDHAAGPSDSHSASC